MLSMAVKKQRATNLIPTNLCPELSTVGFPVAELSTVGFPVAELSTVGFPVEGPWPESFSCIKTVTEPSFGLYWLTPKCACSLVWLS